MGFYEQAIIDLNRAEHLLNRANLNRNNECIWRAKLNYSFGRAMEMSHHYRSARNYYQEGIQIARTLRDKGLVAKFENVLGSVNYQVTGNVNDTLRYFRHFLYDYHESGNRLKKSEALINIGEMYLRMERFETAKIYAERALQLSSVDDLPLKGHAHFLLGKIQDHIDHPLLAYMHYKSAIKSDTLHEKYGTKSTSFFSLGNLFFN